jgi:hypothetical protein
MKGQNKSAANHAEYIAALDGPRRSEVAALDAFIRSAVPTLEPAMLDGMLAYGPFHYRYASGREGESCKVGVASNTQGISIYICAKDENGFLTEQYAARLGKASCGRSCIRFRKFADIHHPTLKSLLIAAAEHAG